VVKTPPVNAEAKEEEKEVKPPPVKAEIKEEKQPPKKLEDIDSVIDAIMAGGDTATEAKPPPIKDEAKVKPPPKTKAKEEKKEVKPPAVKAEAKKEKKEVKPQPAKTEAKEEKKEVKPPPVKSEAKEEKNAKPPPAKVEAKEEKKKEKPPPAKAKPKVEAKEEKKVAPEEQEEPSPEVDPEEQEEPLPESEPEIEEVPFDAKAALASIGGATAPLKTWDPLNLAEVGEMETLRWFRAAELKHSRVAMLATTGYIVQASGYHFPGMLSTSENVSFEYLSKLNPFEAWDVMPDAGKAQIIAGCFVAELASESRGKHYTLGGPWPEVVFPRFDFSEVEPEVMATKRKRELNNGRLAMIGLISFAAARAVPGSVPALENFEIFNI